MRRIYYWLYIVYLSLKWTLQVNLGDLVLYRNKKYRVMNGVRCESWRLDDLNNGDDGWVKRSEVRKVISLSNYIGSFKSGYRFYMGYWFSIWVNNGIEPWVRALRIWPERKAPRTEEKL